MNLQDKENIKGISQQLYRKEGTKFSQRRTLSGNTNIQYLQLWQPSLVLGSLGRAQLVPIAFSGSNLGFRHSTSTKTKTLAHSLEVSKKKVTSLNDIIFDIVKK